MTCGHKHFFEVSKFSTNDPFAGDMSFQLRLKHDHLLPFFSEIVKGIPSTMKREPEGTAKCCSGQAKAAEVGTCRKVRKNI